MINPKSRILVISQKNPAYKKPISAEEFLKQHNYPYIAENKDLYIVSTALKIDDNSAQVDLSCVYAPQAVYYNNNTVDLDKMPYTEPGGLRVKYYDKVRCSDKNIYKKAYKHGFGKEASRLIENANTGSLKKIVSSCFSGLFTPDYN